MTELLGLPYSPWSEKARWALDVRHVPYKSVPYAPLVGELGLRRRLGRWSGPVSVPVLFEDDGRPVPDSTEIARWADRHGDGPRLFPPELETDIARFATLSEEALDAGRPLALARMLRDDEALGEMVPRALRGLIGPLGAPVAAFGIRRTLRKYEANRVDLASHEARLAGVLDLLRAALADPRASGEQKTLLGRFTFADVAMTQALGFVDPPPFGLRMGAASRRSFTDPQLRERYEDLVEWRDAVYGAHRPRASG
jgi:glutathione S-transferase